MSDRAALRVLMPLALGLFDAAIIALTIAGLWEAGAWAELGDRVDELLLTQAGWPVVSTFVIACGLACWVDGSRKLAPLLRVAGWMVLVPGALLVHSIAVYWDDVVSGWSGGHEPHLPLLVPLLVLASTVVAALVSSRPRRSPRRRWPRST